MAQVIVEIGGRNYPLACKEGGEAHLLALAGIIDDKAKGLSASLGTMSETRLLLMSALMIADELHEGRGGAVDPRLAALVERAERLARVAEAA